MNKKGPMLPIILLIGAPAIIASSIWNSDNIDLNTKIFIVGGIFLMNLVILLIFRMIKKNRQK